VVGPDGADVPDGTAGELWVRPPARELMLLEYLNQPAATAAATAGGWYRTGDAVVRHADGTFTFVDRMRDTIRRSGENSLDLTRAWRPPDTRGASSPPLLKER
jgi:crotonobetaine/carnitine-CoA ligase